MIELSETQLFQVSGSRAWVRSMLEKQPFKEAADLFFQAGQSWKSLSKADWLEAFGQHPRIGEKKRQSESRHSRSEQSGVAGANEKVLQELESGNEDYEKRFGHVFLICATGKSAEEMLAELNRRLGNSPQEELENAASEQLKIMNLRLKKELGEGSES